LFLCTSYLFLKSYFRDNLIHQTEHQLQEILILVGQSLAARSENLENIDSVIDNLSKHLEVRITFVSKEGKVLADSDFQKKDLVQLENHLLRPEIISANQTGYGMSVRYSASVKTEMIYLAKPFGEGVLRVALPISGLQNSLWQLQKLLVLGLFFAAVITAAVSLLLARRFAQPLIQMKKAALQLGQGNFKIELPVQGNDELADLAMSMRQLSLRLGELIRNLSKEKNQLQVILDGMAEGVMVLNAEGEILLTNPALRELLSIEAVVVGSTPLELVRSPDLQEIVNEVLEGKGFLEREIEIYRGVDRRYLRIHASPLKTEGQLQGSVLVFYDLSQEKRLEAMRRDFVANVSHELKTPLAAIQGYTETLLGGALRDESVAQGFLKKIEQNSSRLNSILQDLFDLSKVESGRYELKLEKGSIGPLLEELQNIFEKVIEEKKIDFKILGDVNLTLWCDIQALTQILSNLIDNAIKYSESKDKVTLTIASQADGVLFTIQDTGAGIAPEHLPRIFERFYRVDASRSRQLGGTGLGLSIVKHLVLLQGGKIWVESELGKGTCFYILLPQKGII